MLSNVLAHAVPVTKVKISPHTSVRMRAARTVYEMYPGCKSFTQKIVWDIIAMGTDWCKKRCTLLANYTKAHTVLYLWPFCPKNVIYCETVPLTVQVEH